MSRITMDILSNLKEDSDVKSVEQVISHEKQVENCLRRSACEY